MVTNREWLNTLSDEEYASEWLKIEKMLHGDCGFHIEVIMQYLQAEHITTADEDFAEIGWFQNVENSRIYHDRGGYRFFYIYKDNCSFWSELPDVVFVDKEIDQIRTIADKKRKEMGW